MRVCLPMLAGLLLFAVSRPAVAQLENPVFVDDSPVAYELFRRAQDQARENTGEAARLCQELLDEYALKLIPATEAAHDHFIAVRGRVLRLLRSDGALLDRHRVMEVAEAQRLLVAGELERLALTRPLTAPGLEALLRLAQAELEAGRFEAAIDRLNLALAHPDLDARRAAHAWHMRGMAGRYLGDSARLFEAIDALAALASEEQPPSSELDAMLEHLEQLGGRSLPMPIAGVSPLDRTGVLGLTELVAERIWEVPLRESLHARRTVDPVERSPLVRSPRQLSVEGGLMPAAATIAGDVVYINQGHTISAHDRFTGSPIWPQPHVERPSLTVIDREDEQAMDMNIIAVAPAGDRLVTLTGHAHSTTRSSDGRVVCLDARSGALHWSRRLDRLDGAEELEGLFPHGAPIIAEGAVYVLARKISPQSLTSTYLVALDLESGETRWTRHVVSSGSVRRAARAYSSLVYSDGELYVTSGVGAAARIDAATGQTHWLARFSVPLNPTPQEQARRPWEMLAPAIIGDRVLSLQPGLRRLFVLDRETGDLLETRDTVARETWNAPAYLLTNGHFVYAVGRELRAFHIENLTDPVWRLEVPTSGGVGADVQNSPSTPVIVLGRVQLVEGALLVPTDDRLLIVDDRTGEVLHQLEVGPGNPVAVDSQLVLAGLDRLDAYMSLARAEAMLRERITAYPGDPEPAMALLRLASRAENLDLALDAADRAWQAIGAVEWNVRSRETQRTLFAMLLDLHERGAAGNAEAEAPVGAELLYAALERVARTADQRLAQRIALGDWLAVHQPRQAADLFQQVLADRDLASLHREEGGIVRPAAAWVTQRLGALIDRHGAELYAVHADEAASRLRDMLRRDDVDPADLIALAESYPFAPAAMDAVLEAAQRLLTPPNGGEPRAHEALAAVMRFYRGMPRDAGGRLTRAQSDRLLIAASAAHDAAGWHERNETFPRETRLPRVGAQQGEAEVLLGWVVRRHRTVNAETLPADRALVMDRTRMSLLLAPELHVAWTVEHAALGSAPGIDGAPELLDANDEHILLWYDGNPEDPRAVLLDAADGSTRWMTPRLSDHLGDPLALVGRLRDVRQQMPSGEPFDPRGSIPLVRDGTLTIISRTGAVAGFDLAAGAAPLWIQAETLEQVHLAEMRDGLLVLAGVQRQASGSTAAGTGSRTGGGRAAGALLVPGIVVLDARTGESIHHHRTIQPPLDEGITWMRQMPRDVAGVGGGGLLVCASRGGIEVIDLFTGERLAANVSEAARGARRGLFAGETLVFEDARGMLRSMDIESLSISAPFEPPPTGEWGATSLTAILSAPAPALGSGGAGENSTTGEGVFAHYPSRLVRYAADGAIRGVDIVRDARSYRWVLRGEGRLVVVSAMSPTPVGARRPPQVYRIYTFSENCRMMEEAVQLPELPESLQDAMLVDGWLLVSTAGGMLAVPMPPGATPGATR